MANKSKKKNDKIELPDDGIIICYKCGITVNLKDDSTEAYRCEIHKDRFFCSNNCLREYVLADLD